jgi:hypothetical protein
MIGKRHTGYLACRAAPARRDHDKELHDAVVDPTEAVSLGFGGSRRQGGHLRTASCRSEPRTHVFRESNSLEPGRVREERCMLFFPKTRTLFPHSPIWTLVSPLANLSRVHLAGAIDSFAQIASASAGWLLPPKTRTLRMAATDGKAARAFFKVRLSAPGYGEA